MYLFGILSGLLAIFILLKVVGILLGEFLFEGIEGILFGINIWSVILSIVLGFITIYLSAFISAKRASKVSPILLLRNSAEIKLNSKKLKVPNLIQNLFKTGGVLAYKNLKRSKKKYRTTVISITVSVFIFITMSTFINNVFGMTANYYEDYEYNMRISCKNDNINAILSLEDIDEYFLLYTASKREYLRVYDLSKVSTSIKETGYFDNDEKYIGINVMGLNDEAFKKYAKKIGANYEKIKKNGVLIDEYINYDTPENSKERTYNYQIGDTISGMLEDEEKNIGVGVITNVMPYGIENYNYYGGCLVVDTEYHKDIEFDLYYMTIQSSNPNVLEENIEKIGSDIGVRNLEDEVRREKTMVLVIKIFLYGFIGVITLIGITNIFNTITSNMELRQKEFAMLKSVGMTKKEFNRMINLETIFYGTKSLFFGIILGLIGTFALNKAFEIKDASESMFVPTNAILISVVCVFALIFIIMKYSVGKINRQNTIETIRKDNI